ncbi:hypothetical protein Syun_027460 [Stephania yunnanensis]|uniref:Uncharacterized protein n=1 Tax=Stephania yunnanensis TaxID=152371 RepID=A0AAP0HMU3_9MAGN
MIGHGNSEPGLLFALLQIVWSIGALQRFFSSKEVELTLLRDWIDKLTPKDALTRAGHRWLRSFPRSNFRKLTSTFSCSFGRRENQTLLKWEENPMDCDGEQYEPPRVELVPEPLRGNLAGNSFGIKSEECRKNICTSRSSFHQSLALALIALNLLLSSTLERKDQTRRIEGIKNAPSDNLRSRWGMNSRDKVVNILVGSSWITPSNAIGQRLVSFEVVMVEESCLNKGKDFELKRESEVAPFCGFPILDPT